MHKYIAILLIVVTCCFYNFILYRYSVTEPHIHNSYLPGINNNYISYDKKIIGMLVREFVDSSRSNWLGTGPRPIRTIIWYPGTNSNSKVLADTVNDSITVLNNVNISSESSKYPLIIISPGSGQVASSMSWLGYYLSSHGYITVAVTHKGTPQEERQNGPLTLTDFCIWERPKDLSVVLNNLLNDPFFAGRIDTDRIGSAGFSLGGAAAIWVAGARLDLDTLGKNSPPPAPVLEKSINEYLKLTKTDSVVKESISRAGNSYKDMRIKAVFALAPAVGYGFPKKGLSDINVPVKIVAGDKDLIAPVENNAKRYAKFIKNVSLNILPGELGHYTREISKEQRDEELGLVSKLALEFFDKNLKK